MTCRHRIGAQPEGARRVERSRSLGSLRVVGCSLQVEPLEGTVHHDPKGRQATRCSQWCAPASRNAVESSVEPTWPRDLEREEPIEEATNVRHGDAKQEEDPARCIAQLDPKNPHGKFNRSQWPLLNAQVMLALHLDSTMMQLGLPLARIGLADDTYFAGSVTRVA